MVSMGPVTAKDLTLLASIKPTLSSEAQSALARLINEHEVNRDRLRKAEFTISAISSSVSPWRVS